MTHTNNADTSNFTSILYQCENKFFRRNRVLSSKLIFEYGRLSFVAKYNEYVVLPTLVGDSTCHGVFPTTMYLTPSCSAAFSGHPLTRIKPYSNLVILHTHQPCFLPVQT